MHDEGAGDQTRSLNLSLKQRSSQNEREGLVQHSGSNMWILSAQEIRVAESKKAPWQGLHKHEADRAMADNHRSQDKPGSKSNNRTKNWQQIPRSACPLPREIGSCSGPRSAEQAYRVLAGGRRLPPTKGSCYTHTLCPAGCAPERQGKKSRFLYSLKLGFCFYKLTGQKLGRIPDNRLRAKEQPKHTRAWQAMTERDMAQKGRKTRE